MIVELKKYLFIGAQEDLHRFFEEAQRKGFLEFIPLAAKKMIEFPAEVTNLMMAIKILRKLPVKKPYGKGRDLFFANQTAKRILTLKSEIEKFQEEKRLLDAEISRVAPFGSFSMQEIREIEREANRKIQFFCMKTEKRHKTNIADEVIYVGTEYDLDYFIAINRQTTSYPEMVEMHLDRSADELKQRLVFVEEALHEVMAELKGFAGDIDFLQDTLNEHLNAHHLKAAKEDVSYPLDRALFAIEAWVPANRIHSLFALLNGMAVHAEQIAIEKDDRVPTCMENKGLNRIGEDLVKIYDVPATSDKDPSGWILWAFILFFAVIVADAGYGVLFLGLAIFLKFKFPRLEGSGKRLLKLFTLLAASCIVWGVLISSYFGLEVGINNPLSKISLLRYLVEKKADYHLKVKDDVYTYWLKEIPSTANAKSGQEWLEAGTVQKGTKTSHEILDTFTDNLLLECSLLLGVIHVALSFLRYLWRNWAGVGWVVFMVGGYLFFPSILKA
ncbi:MAG: V-type ATP synthase subunit I, partial [Anaerolineae bacterium]